MERSVGIPKRTHYDQLRRQHDLGGAGMPLGSQAHDTKLANGRIGRVVDQSEAEGAQLNVATRSKSDRELNTPDDRVSDAAVEIGVTTKGGEVSGTTPAPRAGGAMVRQ
ncbi:hypothetical protein FGIG_10910 [Fasciola gigantica]|uniref:Uncharacterized protein n=1 Tax=Fasciola gigantica TaxID=46835 RepID=A0A504Z0K9_FASGI|nr:hypothetical protein FGIG_10910 [Fasciola gigantica]